MAGGLRILVVEDDASMRRAMGRLLRAWGFDCTEHESAEALLRCVDPNLWDCLVADIHLPGLSGFELIEALRQMRPGMPAVLVTAIDETSKRERALRLMRVAYLIKPFEAAALVDAIRKLTLSL